MQKIIFLTLLQFIFLQIFSQENLFNYKICPTSVVEEKSGKYLISGYCRNEKNSNSYDVALIQVNFNENKIIAKKFGKNFSDKAYDICILDNNQIVVTGESFNGFYPIKGRENVFFLKLNNKLAPKTELT